MEFLGEKTEVDLYSINARTIKYELKLLLNIDKNWFNV